MLGFSAIADTPIAADNRQDQYLVLVSQSVTLTQNSLALSTAVSLTLDSQNLVTTLNSLTVQAAANFALQSQTLALTQNSLALSTDQVLTLGSQSLALTQNSVGLSLDVVLGLSAQTPLALTENAVQVEVQPPTFDSQSIALTQNSVTLATDQVLQIGSQNLTTTLRSVSLQTSQQITLGSLTLTSALSSVLPSLQVFLKSQSLLMTQRSIGFGASTTVHLSNTNLGLGLTLNSFRKQWVDIATNQIPSTPYDDCSIASTPICYTPPDPSTTPNTQGDWFDIVFDGEVYGDDFAIASQPICGSPYPLPPIGNYPPAMWANITTTQTANWTAIPT